ncbi:MAG: GNAT family N-acetyltransferase [Alphaproteobacteria bacterium]|nr:GNAT family N-acetyltransferase [Alphaproteobacteria bacterium]
MLAALDTDRMYGRPWSRSAEDVQAVWDLYSDDRVTRYTGMARLASPDAVGPWLDAVIGRNDAYPDGTGSLAMRLRATDTIVGTGMLKPIPFADGTLSDTIEVGWHLAPAWWGHGLATEMGRALLRHAFDVLGLDSVIAVVRAENAPSLAVTERLGMVREGVVTTWYGGIPLVQHRAVR